MIPGLVTTKKALVGIKSVWGQVVFSDISTSTDIVVLADMRTEGMSQKDLECK